MHHYTCQHCATPLTCEQDATGQTICCPACGRNTVLLAAAAVPVQVEPVVPVTPVPVTPAAVQTAVEPSAPHHVRRPRRSSAGPLVVVGVGAAGLLAVALVLMNVFREPEVLALRPVANQTVDELAPVSVQLEVQDPGKWADPIEFELVEGPAGAELDPATGAIRWTPTEEQGPASHLFRVKASSGSTASEVARFSVLVREQNRQPIVQAIPDQTLSPGEKMEIAVRATDVDLPAQPMAYQFRKSPRTAVLDRRTGVVSWRPDSKSAGTHIVELEIRDGKDAEPVIVAFQVRVTEAPSSLQQLVADLQKQQIPAELREPRADSLLGTDTCQVLEVDGQEVLVAEFDSPQAASMEVQDLRVRAAIRLAGREGSVFRGPQLIAFYGGEDPTVLNHLTSVLGRPFLARREPTATAAKPPPTPVPQPEPLPPTGPFVPQETDVIAQLLEEGKLFAPDSYETLRGVFASRFVRLHEQAIRQAFGDDYDEMTAWLDENPVVRDELYTAIDPAVDNPTAALQLFKEVKQEFPERVVPYANLAIAVAVTWDDPRAVYDYAHHQRRAKTTLPEGLAGALDNFRYFVEAEKFMQGRAQWLPWEFLVHVINHKTPIAERQWALGGYLGRRAMFGKCYSEVPYDQLMLNTGSEQGRLNGQVYTLPNVLVFGGVCAHRADFSSRVGQSLGVPAAYVHGESVFNDRHAWVMWVEVRAVTPTSIAFTLESDGRFRGDKYYVGSLKDPRSGRKITDRQLELRLHTVGVNAKAKRQAELVMAAFPALQQKQPMDVPQRIDYLSKTVQLCVGNEQAWRAVAQLASDEQAKAEHKQQIVDVINTLFVAFANYPDFTWEIFNDLALVEDDPAKRIGMYQQLMKLYLAAQRPDLACEARLRLTDLLVANEQVPAAVDGLAATILAFVDEGRYVPRMLDRLEAICQDVEGSTPRLLQFYNTFLPRITQKRQNRPSKYCIQMYNRGIAKFRQHGQPQAAAVYQAQLAKLQLGN